METLKKAHGFHELKDNCCKQAFFAQAIFDR